jgi:hypothetical protein
MVLSRSVKRTRSTELKSKPKPKSPHNVRFCEDDSKETVLVDTTLSSSQRDMMWYTPDEMDALKNASRQEDAHLANHASSRRVRHNCIRAILEQQSENKTLGISDPKGLFVVSRALTKVMRKNAQTAAILVAKEVVSGDF